MNLSISDADEGENCATKFTVIDGDSDKFEITTLNNNGVVRVKAVSV